MPSILGTFQSSSRFLALSFIVRTRNSPPGVPPLATVHSQTPHFQLYHKNPSFGQPCVSTASCSDRRTVDLFLLNVIVKCSTTIFSLPCLSVTFPRHQFDFLPSSLCFFPLPLFFSSLFLERGTKLGSSSCNFFYICGGNHWKTRQHRKILREIFLTINLGVQRFQFHVV